MQRKQYGVSDRRGSAKMAPLTAAGDAAVLFSWWRADDGMRVLYVCWLLAGQRACTKRSQLCNTCRQADVLLNVSFQKMSAQRTCTAQRSGVAEGNMCFCRARACQV